MASHDFTNDERFDGLYMNVANTTRGIEPLLDTMFSFLRRKTDFFNGPNGEDTDAAVKKVNQVLQKHVQIHELTKKKEEEKKQQRREKEEAKKRKKQEEERKKKEVELAAAASVEEDVIEMDADQGFDISSGQPSSATANDDADANTAPSPSQDAPTPQSVVTDETSIGTAQKDASVEGTEINTKKDDVDDSNDDGPEPIGNGGTVDGKYVWTQTLSELNLTIPLPENTRGRDLSVIMKKKHLNVALKSQLPNHIVNAPLSKTIVCDDSFWTVEDGNKLVINLQKVNQMEWWDCVCVGDPTIDVKKVQPENSKLDDLDGDTRQTVEKMMFDQRQKAMGLPTSDEQRKFEMLEKFKAAHPEMDFSNAKIS